MTALPPDTWLAADQSWLERQPRMTPWASGLAELTKKLDGWASGYAEQIGARCADPVGVCREALWACWRFHWRGAGASAERPIDGWKVADGLVAARGNVFRDVVYSRCLARTRHERDDELVARFQAEYMLPTARCVEPGARYRSKEVPDWWNDLLDHLIGYTKPGKLLEYGGAGPLAGWLVKVAGNVRKGANRRPKSMAGGDGGLAGRADPRTPAGLEHLSEKCMQLLVQPTADVLKELSGEERLLARYVYVDQKPGKLIAELVGRHAGTVSRQTAGLEAQLCETLPAAYRSAPAYGDCADLLLGGRHRLDLGQLIADALKTVEEA